MYRRFGIILDQLLLAVEYCDKGTRLISNIVAEEGNRKQYGANSVVIFVIKQCLMLQNSVIFWIGNVTCLALYGVQTYIASVFKDKFWCFQLCSALHFFYMLYCLGHRLYHYKVYAK